MSIKKNVKNLREQQDMTQGELAEKVGVSQVFISYIELGYKNPSLELCTRLAEVLGCTIDELVKD